jgi:hypothetical protein
MTTTSNKLTAVSHLYQALLAVETDASAAPDMRRILSQERQELGLVIERSAGLHRVHHAAEARERKAERALDAAWSVARSRYSGIEQQVAHVRDEQREHDAATDALRAAAAALHRDAVTITRVARTAESWGVEVRS